MPYTHTSWTAFTDPAGNARTLDWTEEGMSGQFAGAYLEALRQAAVLRNDVCRSWVPAIDGVAPGEVTLRPVDSLRRVLEFIDRVAWTPRGSEIINGNGWILPSQWQSSYEGEASVPYWSTVADMEAEIAATRIPVQRLYDTPDGTLLGAWMRQVKTCFQNIVYSVGTSGTAVFGAVFGTDPETRTGSAPSFPDAVIAHDAAAWVPDAHAGLFPGHGAYDDFITCTVWRHRRAIIWQPIWPNGGLYTPSQPTSADLYIVCSPGYGAYENNDIPGALSGKLYRLHAAADLTGPAASEILADYDAATVTAAGGIGGIDGTGYIIASIYAISDWTAAWPLA